MNKIYLFLFCTSLSNLAIHASNNHPNARKTTAHANTQADNQPTPQQDIKAAKLKCLAEQERHKHRMDKFEYALEFGERDRKLKAIENGAREVEKRMQRPPDFGSPFYRSVI
jgi:hypothetical protein